MHPHMDDFERIAERALAARLTIPELRERADISRYAYWRAQTRKSNKDAQVRVLRALESTLDQIERERTSV